MNVNDIKHAKLKKWIWILQSSQLPNRSSSLTGVRQYDELIASQIADGYCVALNPEKKPGCVAYNSDPPTSHELRTEPILQLVPKRPPHQQLIDPVELKET